MTKKGAVGVETFVRSAAILIALVALILVVPHFTKQLYAASEKGQCQWSVLVSALTRTPGVGIENIPIECKAKYINLTLEDAQANYNAAAKAINVYRDRGPEYDAIYKIFNSQKSESQLAEWSVDKILADEMVSCWDKVWKGKMPMFDEWWKIIGYSQASADQEKLALAKTQGLPGKEEDMKWYHYAYLWNLQWKSPPTFCVVCTRIKFGKDITPALGRADVNSLSTWMMFNQVPKTSISYFEYLLSEDQKNTPALFRTHEIKYDTSQPYAVLYQRINIHKVDELSQGVLDFIGLVSTEETDKKVDRVLLVPYDSVLLPYDHGGANCNYVID